MNRNFRNHLFNPYFLHENVPLYKQLSIAHNIYRLGPNQRDGGNPTQNGIDMYKNYLSQKHKIRNDYGLNKNHVQVGPWFHHGDYMDHGGTNKLADTLNMLSYNGKNKHFNGRNYVVHK